MNALVVAGTHSGVGKTTIAVGIIAALRRRGATVQPFKVGPDYIDPSYHTLAAGRPARNLDTWLIPRERVSALVAWAGHDADIAVVEGVMGLFDGFDYDTDTGSTADVAKLLHVPVILVIDARAMARSAAAMALGYGAFDPDLPLGGFIINHVAGENHGRGLARAITHTTGLPVFGWVPQDPALEIPERHLGLIPTSEPGRWDTFLRAAANAIEHHVDLEALLSLARTPAPPPPSSNVPPSSAPGGTLGTQPSRPRPIIAVAHDEAFSFFYQDNLDLLRDAGARVVLFSPLRDTHLPEDTRAIILSGGFPEVYAAQLAHNRAMHRALHDAHARGLRIYAECGGLMYLTEEIVTQRGDRYPMVGLLPGRSVMTGRLSLGYRIAEAAADSWIFRKGERVRGHEFHYSMWDGRPTDLPPAYRLIPPRGDRLPQDEGASLDNLWASYVHLHFWTQPELARRFTCGLNS